MEWRLYPSANTSIISITVNGTMPWQWSFGFKLCSRRPMRQAFFLWILVSGIADLLDNPGRHGPPRGTTPKKRRLHPSANASIIRITVYSLTKTLLISALAMFELRTIRQASCCCEVVLMYWINLSGFWRTARRVWFSQIACEEIWSDLFFICQVQIRTCWLGFLPAPYDLPNISRRP